MRDALAVGTIDGDVMIVDVETGWQAARVALLMRRQTATASAFALCGQLKLMSLVLQHHGGRLLVLAFDSGLHRRIEADILRLQDLSAVDER